MRGTDLNQQTEPCPDVVMEDAPPSQPPQSEPQDVVMEDPPVTETVDVEMQEVDRAA